MSGWGIAETAPVIEKIKAESADYLRGLNSCGDITWSVYDKAFDFYMELISRAYEQGKKDAQPMRKKGEWIPVEVKGVPYGIIMKCNKCNFETMVNDALYYNYCPNCGSYNGGYAE